MSSQFSPRVSQILAFSREEATRLASRSVGPEHLLLGMLRDKTDGINHIFQDFEVNTDHLKMEIEQKVREDELQEPVTTDLVLNQQASNILKLAVLEARIQHQEVVNEEHVLLAILHDQMNNGAKIILEENNLNYEDTLSYISKGNPDVAKDYSGIDDDEDDDDDDIIPQNNDTKKSSNGSSTQTATAKPNQKTPVLDNFSTDLTQAAREGKLDPVIGRDKEILRVIEILSRRKKNNPILIGEPGVGKSAIVEGLAQLIVSQQCSPILFNKRLVSLDLTAVVAGTKYRGQFEERIRALIKELEKNTDIIVFIDEIHTIIGAGSTPGSMDAANILKPALARGTIQCIGATTIDEFRKSIEKDGALERRFQKVLIEPTNKVDTLLILQRIKDRYEKFHHVSYSDEALQACVNLADRYITDRAFPDKAIDILDEVGAKSHVGHVQVPDEIMDKQKTIDEVKKKKQMAVRNQNFELAAGFRDQQKELETELEQLQEKWREGDLSDSQVVDEHLVAEVVSRMTGVPAQRMADGETSRLRNMAAKLQGLVIGQDQAIVKMVKSIQRNRIGLRDPNHPIGAFMFLGPTGVGKTYLAKTLAKEMFGSEDALIRVDMSEYTEQFNASRLIGAPPGYVGYEEGGQLTERVRRHPYSIVLLDEIEKAHSSIFNILLQVLDEGRLTDGLGRTVDFRNTVIIMTSNAGTRQLKEFSHGVGFTAGGASGIALNDKDKEYARGIIQKSLAKQFSPEFLNRLDEIITFDQLDMSSIKKIIDLELKGLFNRVSDLGYQLSITDKAKEYVATKGYDVQFGARPLKRAIQNYIEDLVCEELLNENLQPGAEMKIKCQGDKLTLTSKAG